MNGAGERGGATATARLHRHHLRLGGRRVLLLEGPCGWGECSPLDGYPCSPSAALAAATEAAARPWPSPVRDVIPVNALVSSADFDPASLAGFPCVKVKVVRADPGGDLGLVSAVRDAVGPSVALRVDANGAWDEDTAEWMLTRLAPFGLELAEQPVAGIESMSRLRRRVDVPLAADECVRSIEDARRLHRLSAADAIVLKVQPLGGMWPSLRLAEASALPALVTTMMETSVGIAMGLRLAASLPELPYACGLATAGALGDDVTAEPLVATGGLLRVRRVVPDPSRLLALADPYEPEPYEPEPYEGGP
jgi:o-succinylbenzoate synthase